MSGKNPSSRVINKPDKHDNNNIFDEPSDAEEDDCLEDEPPTGSHGYPLTHENDPPTGGGGGRTQTWEEPDKPWKWD